MPSTTGTAPGDFAATDGSVSKFEHPDQVLIGGSNPNPQFTGISIPAGVTITGFEVLLVAAVSQTAQNTPAEFINVSVNDGSAFGSNVTPSPNSINLLSSGFGSLTYGGSTELWGIPLDGGWSTLVADDAANLLIRLNTAEPNGNIIYVDQLTVKIYYETPALPSGTIKLSNGLTKITRGTISL